MSTVNIQFVHPSYSRKLPEWEQAEDVLAGEREVKERGTRYLPASNSFPEAEGQMRSDAIDRYNSYKLRATFVPFASRTLGSLIGAVYRKDPTLKLASGLKYAETNIDGYGKSIYQQSQLVLRHLLATGRCGILVDYPRVGEEGQSQADQEQNHAVALMYRAIDIVDWRTTRQGSQHILSYVKLREFEDVVSDDGLSVEVKCFYRVLDLFEGKYRVRVFTDGGDIRFPEAFPTNSAGSTWNYIPFFFFGAVANEPGVGPAPLTDLIGLNLAHYQVYADWRRVLYLAANPQPVVTGLDEDWRNHLEAQGIKIGSDAALLLPQDGDFKWAQINADQPLRAELDAIMDQAIALGARLIERGTARTMTATQAEREAAAEHSVLSLCAANVSEGYIRVLQAMGEYENATGDSSIELSREYIEETIEPTMLTSLVNLWQSGTVPKKDVWEYLRRVGLLAVDRTDAKLTRETDEQDEGLGLDREPAPANTPPASGEAE